jgi:hypothetical protein
MTLIEPRAVVLVEGDSDRAAVRALGRRLGRDLEAEGTSVIAMGGATNIGRFLQRFGPPGLDVRLAGLYDVGEERIFRRGLERAGLGSDPISAELEARGFYVCDADLEDELIRALGVDAVEAVIAAEGELASLRRMQRQPAQRGRPADQQLRRFIGTRSGRKIRYGSLLVDALDLPQVPRPLWGVLAAVSAG